MASYSAVVFSPLAPFVPEAHHQLQTFRRSMLRLDPLMELHNFNAISELL